MLLHIINHSLFSLNVLEHKLGLWKSNIVREHLGVLFIKLEHFRKSLDCFRLNVASLQKLAYIVIDKIVFENADHMRVLIVNDVIHYFRVVVLSRCQILFLKIFFHHRP